MGRKIDKKFSIRFYIGPVAKDKHGKDIVILIILIVVV